MDNHFSHSLDEVIQRLYQTDGFSKWLGIEILEIKKGYSLLQMKVRKEMLNGLNITHGGILFSFADTACAFASMSRNIMTVSLQSDISFLKPTYENDILLAEATELHNGNTIAVYNIHIFNENKQTIVFCKGICYKTNKTVV
jgi:acyl-CoA thioesterase